MIRLRHRGSFSNLEKSLRKSSRANVRSILEQYGEAGVLALSEATPVDSGETADSWYYEITEENGKHRIRFCNRHVNQGVPIAIILQLGHGTGTGGWVEGMDYINPALQPIFEGFAKDIVEEVSG